MAGAAPAHQRVDTGLAVPAPTRAMRALPEGLVLVDGAEQHRGAAWARRGTPRSQRDLSSPSQRPSEGPVKSRAMAPSVTLGAPRRRDDCLSYICGNLSQTSRSRTRPPLSLSPPGSSSPARKRLCATTPLLLVRVPSSALHGCPPPPIPVSSPYGSCPLTIPNTR